MRFAHTTIYTHKFEESIAFYQAVAKLDHITRLPSGLVAFLSDAEDATRIEILNSDPVYKGEGISVGFAHPDPDAYREELKSKGYDVSEMNVINEKIRFFFVKDPNGVNVQFIKNRAGRIPAAIGQGPAVRAAGCPLVRSAVLRTLRSPRIGCCTVPDRTRPSRGAPRAYPAR